jgi:ribonuclease P/MRP protein subunit POP7
MLGKRSEQAVLNAIEEGVKDKARKEEVLLKATGKAIEKALALAVWFQGQDDVEVVVRTSSVGAVDDIIVLNGEEEDTSRVRRTSSLEVAIKLR